MCSVLFRSRSAPTVKRSRIKVTVVVTTFNHANLIEEALDGILDQDIDFPIEILVHDDASTDGTQAIVKRYAAEHPDLFKPLLQSQNQHSKGKRIFPILWPYIRGEYVALLDGDDVWKDRTKLTEQVEFLDQHPGCSICQTRTIYFDQTQQRILRTFPSKERSRERHNLSDLAIGNFIQNSAVMFRLDALPKLPDDWDRVPIGDYALFALIARRGWIGLIDKEMTLYRVHDTNAWYNKSEAFRVQKTRMEKAYIYSHLSYNDRILWILARYFAASRLWNRIKSLTRNLRIAR